MGEYYRDTRSFDYSSCGYVTYAKIPSLRLSLQRIKFLWDCMGTTYLCHVDGGDMAPHTRDRCCQSPCGQALRNRSHGPFLGDLVLLFYILSGSR